MMTMEHPSCFPPQPVVATDSRWICRLRGIERWVFGALLFARMFSFPDPPAVSLDPSWRLVLTRAFFDGMQFGRDIVFTYGPLGFLMGNTYDGVHFWELVAWHLVKSAGFAMLIIHVAERLPWGARWVCFTAFLLFSPPFDDPVYLLLVVLLVSGCMREHEPRGWSAGWAIGAGLALVSALKFTNLMFAAVAVLIAVGLNLRLARYSAAGRLLLGYVGGFVAIWLLARQSLGNLPEYFINSWYITRGYDETMGLPPPAPALAKALMVVLLFSICLGWRLAWCRREPRAVAMILLLAVLGFVMWKHGFLRADGHMGGFFTGMLLLACLVPALLAGAGRFPAVQWGLLASVAFFSIWGLDDALTITRSNAWAIFTEKLTGHVDHVRHWQSFRTDYDTELSRLLTEFPLKRTRAKVGRESIDVLGHDVGIICLHDFNYRPRPVFQSYSAYTPELAQLNRDFLLSDKAPAFFLQKVQSIDERPLTLDDAWVLRLLSTRYEFVFAENGYLLWQRRQASYDPPVNPPPLLAGSHALGEPLPIENFAGQPLWLAIDLPLSLAGQWRSAIFQPPLVYLRLTDQAGVITDYRLPLPQARGGFIVNPRILDAADYLAFVGGALWQSVRSLEVVIKPEDRRLFADRFDFTLTAFAVPPVERKLGELARHTRFHMLVSTPVSETAFAQISESEINGQPVLLAHAPSEMVYELPPHPVRLTGSFGFIEGAYTGGGLTDGATFQVLWTDGRQRHVLFSRRLDPVRVPADRGLQPLAVDLGGRQGGRLLLSVNAGPAGENDWDWTAWTGISIE